MHEMYDKRIERRSYQSKNARIRPKDEWGR